MTKAGLWLAVVLASIFASGEEPATPSASVNAEHVNAPSAQVRSGHKFWDRETALLFGLHAGLEAADFGLTHHALAHDAVERNPLAKPFTNLSGTAATLGISYWLHKRGHHRVERLVGLYAIGDSGFGVVYNATHPPSSPATYVHSR